MIELFVVLTYIIRILYNSNLILFSYEHSRYTLTAQTINVKIVNDSN